MTMFMLGYKDLAGDDPSLQKVCHVLASDVEQAIEKFRKHNSSAAELEIFTVRPAGGPWSDVIV